MKADSNGTHKPCGPYVLAWAPQESPLQIVPVLGNGATVPHLATAAKVLAHEGDAHICVISAREPGPGLTLGGTHWPGTHTLALVSLDEHGDVVLDIEHGMPPTSAFFWTASLLLDCMARYHVTTNIAQQQAKAQVQQSIMVARPGTRIVER